MFYKLIRGTFLMNNLYRRNFQHLSSSYIPSNVIKNINNMNFKYNLDYNEIYKEEKDKKEGIFLKNNVYSIDTGKFTGRSPNDKYIVLSEDTKKNIWWGDVNKPISDKIFQKLYKKCYDHYNNNVSDYYIYDGYCGANPKTRKKVRFLTEYIWQHHFVKNMFIKKEEEIPMEEFKPDMTIINSCNIINKDWKEDKLNSENFIILNIDKKIGLIGGTRYGGEMKKGIFSLMNYWLPQKDILTMHCSANINQFGDTTLFFGLSGTGKTTLSTDENTRLIGDDEHGWDDDGIFNLEGGCYAKTNGLSKKNEPTIYNAIKKNALLENIYIHPETREPDYFNIEKTENGRVSYPLEHIPNYEKSGRGGHPKNIIFLTCDRFGIFPLVSFLEKEKAIEFFLKGYTSKVAGTERGVKVPEATFSPCFGGAFLTLSPEYYGNLLLKKLNQYHCNVFLVNTGWNGEGERYSIQKTREYIYKIMDGSIHKLEKEKDNIFGIDYPKECNPIQYWKKKDEFYKKQKELFSKFNNKN